MTRKETRALLNATLARIEAANPAPEGFVWHIEEGSVTYGRWWRLYHRSNPGGLHNEKAAAPNARGLLDQMLAYAQGLEDANR